MMETGRTRKRRDRNQSLELIQVQWVLTEDLFDSFVTFYGEELENGSLAFALLLSPDEDEELKEVCFTGDQYKFSRSDNVFVVQSTLCLLPSETAPPPATLTLIYIPLESSFAVGVPSAVVVVNNVVYGTSDVFWSTTDGLNFVSLGTSSTTIDAFIRGGALFVGVGSEGYVATSSDCIDWTNQSSGVGDSLRDIAYGGGMFVAVGNSGAIINSSNGIDWNTVSVSGGWFSRVIYADSQFVAVGEGGMVYTSPNGTDWTSQTSGLSDAIFDVVYGAGILVAIAMDFNTYTSSDRGVTWTPHVDVFTTASRSIAYGMGQFIVGSFDGSVWSSVNGTTWTQIDTTYTWPVMRTCFCSPSTFVLQQGYPPM
jgi:hypothetical protein